MTTTGPQLVPIHALDEIPLVSIPSHLIIGLSDRGNARSGGNDSDGKFEVENDDLGVTIELQCGVHISVPDNATIRVNPDTWDICVIPGDPKSYRMPLVDG